MWLGVVLKGKKPIFVTKDEDLIKVRIDVENFLYGKNTKNISIFYQACKDPENE